MITNKNATAGSRSGTEDHDIMLSDMYIDGNKDNQGAGAVTLWCVGFSTVKNLWIQNITVIDGWTAGIRTEFCTNVFIENNRVENSGDDGIAINEETYYATVNGNIIIDSGQGAKTYGSPAGIEIQDGAHHISVVSNNVQNSENDGIQVSTHSGKSGCYEVAIAGNAIFSDENNGIGIAGLSGNLAYSITVANNIISDTSAVGIFSLSLESNATYLAQSANNVKLDIYDKL